MPAVPRSIGARLLAHAARASPPASRAAIVHIRTYATNESDPHQHTTSSEDAPTVKLTSDSTQTREQSAAEGMRHQPDYNVAVDYRTSNFSPVPKRVMDGSEPGESVAAAVLSGAPVDLQARTVRCVAHMRQLQRFLLTAAASTAPQRRPPSLATGMLHTGSWTGTCCPRATGGRTR
jgi:NADH dehydrogenase (ubiquinone) Fe-S protein 4